jgi:hypothetical protein
MAQASKYGALGILTPRAGGYLKIRAKRFKPVRNFEGKMTQANKYGA